MAQRLRVPLTGNEKDSLRAALESTSDIVEFYRQIRAGADAVIEETD